MTPAGTGDGAAAGPVVGFGGWGTWDLIIKAWTAPEIFSWYGADDEYRYVNIWPRPVQQPHPPIYIPGAGSSEKMKFCAERKYTYMSYDQLGGFGQLIALFAIGPSTHEQIMHSSELFASEVMPALRPPGVAADAATA